MAQGAAIQMIDAAGNKIELRRDGKRNLQQVVGPNGTVIHLSYDDADRVVRAEDSDKNWTTYKYNSKGFLTDVVHSSGSARYYFYEDDLLTYM